MFAGLQIGIGESMIRALAASAIFGILSACATAPTTTEQTAAPAATTKDAATTKTEKKVVCSNERDEEISSRMAVRRVCRPVAPAKQPDPAD
jgi:uncharacterized lipoprotein YajG